MNCSRVVENVINADFECEFVSFFLLVISIFDLYHLSNSFIHQIVESACLTKKKNYFQVVMWFQRKAYFIFRLKT